MLKTIKYYVELSLMTEGLFFLPSIALDRILFYIFFNAYYKYKFKSYGDDIYWGKYFAKKIIPNSVRIACPEKISIGSNCQIDEGVYLQCYSKGNEIVIGNNVRINAHSHFLAHSKITIGDKVLFAPYSLVVSGNHETHLNQPIMEQGMKPGGDIVIDSGTWLGQGASVLGNSTIPKNSVVAARAVVRGHYDKRGILAGVPAKIIKEL